MTVRTRGGLALVDARLGATSFSQIRVGSTVVWNRSGLRDDFERADAVGLGAAWTTFSATADQGPSIVSGTLRHYVNGSLIGLSPVSSSSRYNAAVLPGDNGYVQATIAAKNYMSAQLPTSLIGRMSNGTFTDGALLDISNGQLSLASLINGAYTPNIAGAASGSYDPGDLVRLEFEGNIYRIIRNGVNVQTWPDVGNTIKTGSGFRSCGQRTTGSKVSFAERRYSAALADWEAGPL